MIDLRYSFHNYPLILLELLILMIFSSFDVRKKNPNGGGLEGQHWSAPTSFGGRAFFRAERNTSYLLITNVTADVSNLSRYIVTNI